MGKVKQIELKNWTYCFYNNINSIEEFNSSLLKIDKKSCKDIDIYYIGCIDCENIYSINPLYLIIGKVDRHIECNSVEFNSVERSSTECNSIEEKKNEYLIFDSTDENKEVFKKYIELWDEIKN